MCLKELCHSFEITGRIWNVSVGIYIVLVYRLKSRWFAPRGRDFFCRKLPHRLQCPSTHLVIWYGSCHVVKLTTRLHLIQMVRMNGSMPLLLSHFFLTLTETNMLSSILKQIFAVQLLSIIQNSLLRGVLEFFFFTQVKPRVSPETLRFYIK
jgi:hypothetical protein